MLKLSKIKDKEMLQEVKHPLALPDLILRLVPRAGTKHSCSSPSTSISPVNLIMVFLSITVTVSQWPQQQSLHSHLPEDQVAYPQNFSTLCSLKPNPSVSSLVLQQTQAAALFHSCSHLLWIPQSIPS